MAVVGFGYFGWLFMSPLNLIAGVPFFSLPPLYLIVINTIIYIPLIYFTVRYWLRNMLKRQKGPAAGIDTVEPSAAEPEEGDEWGRATRPYRAGKKSKVSGSKSELREAIALDSSFFVKTPDLDTGESLFDLEELHARAMIRSRVASGGWAKKRVSSRAVGSLKAQESLKHGRPSRWRTPSADPGSIHLPATIMAAVSRSGKFEEGRHIEIKPEDLRESVFTGRTPLTIILVIDVSLSMKGSMNEVRKLVERIERETRGSKDRVGIVAFKDSGAVEVQAPTTNWNKIYRALARLRISGLTPLADALMKALETIKREKMRNRDIEPLVVVISDFAPNIPLAQSAGPGEAQYTPVRDLVKASRLLKKNNVRIAAVSANPDHKRWPKFLKRPYHEALELATMLRTRKEGFSDPMETLLTFHEFRQTFGAYIVARSSGGHAFLSSELMKEKSVINAILDSIHSQAKMSSLSLKEAEAYIPS